MTDDCYVNRGCVARDPARKSNRFGATHCTIFDYNPAMSDYKFFHPTEVRYGDLDPQGHVNNAKHLTYFEQARVHYLIQLGLFSRDQSFMEIGVVIADIHIAYMSPVHYDDNIKVGVKTVKIGNKSSDSGAVRDERRTQGRSCHREQW